MRVVIAFLGLGLAGCAAGRPAHVVQGRPGTERAAAPSAAAARMENEPTPWPIEAVICRINKLRRDQSLSLLVIERRLLEEAQGHSRDMARMGELTSMGPDRSTTDDRLTRSGYDWQWYRELIFWGYRSPSELVKLVETNNEYRSYILSEKATEVGFGMAYSRTRIPYSTLVLASRRHSDPTGRLPSCRPDGTWVGESSAPASAPASPSEGSTKDRKSSAVASPVQDAEGK